MALIQVNRATLGNKRMKALTSFTFAAKTTAFEIVLNEFSAVATNYPIFFMEQNGALIPLALLGLREGDNLFVEADGRWSGSYMPAMLRRYPFSVRLEADGTPTLLLDDQSGLLSDTEGEPLFGESEESGPVARALALAAQADMQIAPTRSVVAKIASTGIIQPVSITVQEGETVRALTGLQAIAPERFNALPDDVILDLRRSGALLPIYAHIVSLGQVTQLQARHNFRHAAA